MAARGRHGSWRDLVIVSLGSGLNFVVVGMTRPLVPLFAAAFDSSSARIGAIVATYALVSLFLAIPGGRWVDRWGCRRIYTVGSLAVVVGMGIVSAAPTLPVLLLSQVLAGAGELLVILSGQTFIIGLSDGARREGDLGWYMTFISGGYLVGPLLGGVVSDNLGFPGAFGVAALVGSLAAGVGMFVGELPTAVRTSDGEAARDTGDGEDAPKEGVTHRRSPEIRDVLRNSGVRVAMTSSFGLIFAMGVRQAFFPLYAGGLGFSATAIGFLLSLRALSSMLVRPFMPSLIKLFGSRFRALTISMGIGALSIGLIPVASTYIPLTIVSVLAGIGAGLVQPLSMLAVAESTGSADRGLAMGVRLMGNRFATFINPVFFGLVAEVTNLGVAFYAGGVILLGITILMGRWRDVFAQSERFDSDKAKTDVTARL